MALRSTYRISRFWQKKIIFSDEAHFDLGGYVSKQNCRIVENEQGEAVTVNGNRYKAKLNEFLAKVGFNRMALRITQPKLHSMFCVLFLKIALSAAELMSFGHLGVATAGFFF